MPTTLAGKLHLQPLATIRHADVGGCRVILDLRQEKYHVLDAVASRMWPVLTGETESSAALAEMARDYNVPVARLECDLDTFATLCTRSGFLHSPLEDFSVENLAPAQPRADSRPARPSVFRALHAMLSTARAIRREGFTATYLRCDQLARGTDTEGADPGVRAFRRAENFYLAARGSDDCLARSLALFRFLNGANIRADHVIGVCRFPFRAHAWVEIDGVPALQTSVADYTPLARL